MSNPQVVRWLREATGFVMETQPDQTFVEHLGQTFRHDTISANRYLQKIWEMQTPLMACPVINVLSPDDPLTMKDAYIKSNWSRLSEEVQFIEVPAGGHYFIKSEPKWVAAMLNSLPVKETEVKKPW